MIRAIAREAWPVAYADILSKAQLTYMLERMYSLEALHQQLEQGHRFLLAEQTDEALGFASHGAPDPGSLARLHKLYLRPAARGQGHGEALLEAVMDACRSAGATRLELNVNKRNPARTFYERHGFRVDRDEVLDIGQGFVMDDHVLVRLL